MTMEDIPDATDDVLRIWRTEKMQYLLLTIGSKRFFLGHAKQIKSEYPTYECKLPKSMEYHDDPNISCE